MYIYKVGFCVSVKDEKSICPDKEGPYLTYFVDRKRLVIKSVH